ncbi:MAG: hypothetical protein ACOH5I_00995 [Oligoflexus sp.]
MSILRFFFQLRILTMATLLVMILMRLVWMDLRVYELIIDPRLAHGIEDLSRRTQNCELRHDDGQGIPGIRTASEAWQTWPKSHLYQAFFQLSCRHNRISADSYIRMNQGVLVLIVLSCVLICRMYCRSWLMCLAVAALLLSRGRFIAANGTMSGQMLTTLAASLWLLSLFHWLRTASYGASLVQAVLLFALLSIETSLWPMAWAVPIGMGLAYLMRGPLLKPVLERVRQTQMQERWYAQLVVPDSALEAHGQQQKLFHNVKRLLGLVRPSDWSYQPLAVKFRKGSLLRPLKVPFFLWIYHKKQWPRLLRQHSFAAAILSVAALLLYALSASPHHVSLSMLTSPGQQWWIVLWQQIDLDLSVGMLIIALGLSRGLAAGLVSYWDSAFLLALVLLLGLAGIWLWDAMSFELASQQSQSIPELWRSKPFLLWFEPVILTFAAIGIYNLIRIFDRSFFKS